MSNRLTKGRALVGALTTSGALSVASGPLTASSTIFSGVGFTTASILTRHLRISVASLNGLEVNTGVTIPLGSIVRDCYLHIKTQEATANTKTMSVGLLSTGPGGMTAGFLLNVGTASVGVVRGIMSSASVSAGSLFQRGSAASGRFWEPFVTSGTIGLNVSYTTATVHTELVADIVIDYDQVILG